MSFRSMTGYGRADVSGFDVVISTVNRKQFDCGLSIARCLAPLEPKIVAKVKEAITRGRVMGAVQLSQTGEASESASQIVVDEALARNGVETLRGVAMALGLEDDLKASDLLRFPDIISVSSADLDLDGAWPGLETALEAALAEVVSMRAKEGAAMEADILGRLESLEKLNREIAALAGGQVERKRADLYRRLEQAGLPVDLDDERVLKELALFAERADITEEITRINSHVEQVREAAKEKAEDPVGRRLDFLCQELGREINTIGSKSADGEISKRVIGFKSELERMREQVQNVE